MCQNVKSFAGSPLSKPQAGLIKGRKILKLRFNIKSGNWSEFRGCDIMIF